MNNSLIRLTIVAGIQAALFLGCDPGTDPVTGPEPNTCEGCHTSETTLKKYAPAEGETGDGGG